MVWEGQRDSTSQTRGTLYCLLLIKFEFHAHNYESIDHSGFGKIYTLLWVHVVGWNGQLSVFVVVWSGAGWRVGPTDDGARQLSGYTYYRSLKRDTAATAASLRISPQSSAISAQDMRPKRWLHVLVLRLSRFCGLSTVINVKTLV